MAIYLRQICLVAEKLAPVMDDLVAILGARPCFIDPAVKAFGLENTLLSIGTNFLEVVAPVEPGTAAGRYLDRRKGNGGYMVICQVSTRAEQAEVKARAAAHNVRVAFEHGDDTHNIMQLHPGDMRAAFLEVDWDAQANSTGNWEPAGGLQWQDKVQDDVTQALVGATLQGPDPLALAQHWRDVTGIEYGIEDGVPTLPLANGTLRFVVDADGRGPGLQGVVVQVADRTQVIAAAIKRNCFINENEIEICGTRFYLSA